ncbi:hypothetical protein AM571_PC00136 (plasmid) [Rhizobium etli 8C-3]|uniref:Uncharacterized protein n=1 Tax=Rhizobium etli 8C-3 TaxID=538025 RepID=A0A1L5PCG2_RHIET|nr:hypothetical protein AM571_PC00136 [Rhizobium etli 8C-3]
MKPIRRVCAGRVGGMLAQRKTGKVAFAGPSWPTDATLLSASRKRACVIFLTIAHSSCDPV